VLVFLVWAGRCSFCEMCLRTFSFHPPPFPNSNCRCLACCCCSSMENKRKTSKSKRTDTTDDDRGRRKRKPGPASRALKQYYAKQKQPLLALQKKEPTTFEHKFDAAFEFKQESVSLVTPRHPDVNLSTALNLKVVCAAPQKRKHRRPEQTDDDIPDTARIDLTEEEDPRA
jgi:hypothetical protein